jgi:cytochrome P450
MLLSSLLQIDENLTVLLMDFFLAGTETPISMVTYAVFFMMLNPECQRKVQAEIDRVIKGSEITMTDLDQ